jgi:peroxiredoxin Q/BCP
MINLGLSKLHPRPQLERLSQVHQRSKPIMKLVRLAVPLALLSTSPVLAALPVGASAPDFTTQATLAGKPFTFHLADALRKGPVVLYFYPAAFTSGCTVEAHEFAEATAGFAALGATVIGVSADPIDKLNRFSVSECRNKFAVASANGKLISAYKVKIPLLGKSNRTSFVIAPDGRIIFEYSALNPSGHVDKTLAAVKSWRAGHPA